MMSFIPIIDLTDILSTECSNNSASWKEVSAKLDEILSGIGFVYIKNHGIGEDIINEAFRESEKFFKLDFETKSKYLKDHRKGPFGYVKPNQEILNPSESISEYRESFDFGWTMINELKSPNSDMPNFYSSLFNLATACTPLVKKLNELLALALNLPNAQFFNDCNKSFFQDYRINNYSTFRSIYYPPLSENDKLGVGSVRCGSHSDYGQLTLLFQDEIGGLEVKGQNSQWIQATPIQGTILLNIGDLLHFWTGGKYNATEHRVLIPENEVKRKTHRQSIAFFIHPDDSVMVTPLIKVPGTEIKSYEPVSAYDHTKKRLDDTYKY